nr:MAG TPA: hypothetical protein [Caudoviricetes sp.]
MSIKPPNSIHLSKPWAISYKIWAYKYINI